MKHNKIIALSLALVLLVFPPFVVRGEGASYTHVVTKFAFVLSPQIHSVNDPYINWPVLCWAGLILTFVYFWDAQKN